MFWVCSMRCQKAKIILLLSSFWFHKHTRFLTGCPKEHKLLMSCHTVFQFLLSTSKMWAVIFKSLSFISVFLEITSSTLITSPSRLHNVVAIVAWMRKNRCAIPRTCTFKWYVAKLPHMYKTTLLQFISDSTCNNSYLTLSIHTARCFNLY
jgi:hypothetical protein